MAWLLDEDHPSVTWRALVDLIGRPMDARAVQRARGAADASKPLATLLAPLDPDGRWRIPEGPWDAPEGAGWRLAAAVQLGADPGDPRLDAAARRLVAGRLPLDAGSPCVAARAAETLSRLGWTNAPVLTELLAWLEEGAVPNGSGGWRCADPSHGGLDGGCVVTAVGVMAALAAPGARRRPALAVRAREVLLEALGAGFEGAGDGWPNLLRTGRSEILVRLAMAGVPWEPRMDAALKKLQSSQDAEGRWVPEVGPEGSWGGASGLDRPGRPSRWLTLHALIVLRAYAVPAALPRLFPERPSSPQ